MIFAHLLSACLTLLFCSVCFAEAQTFTGICPSQMEELLEDSQPVLGVPKDSIPQKAPSIENTTPLRQKVIIKRKCHFKTQTVTQTIQDTSTVFVTPAPNRIVYVKRRLVAKKVHTVSVTTPVWIGTISATTCINPATVRATVCVPTATSVSQIWHTTGPIDCISATPVTIQIETVIEDEGC